LQAKVTWMALVTGGKPHAQSAEEVRLNTEQAEKWQGRWNYYKSLLDEPIVKL
jgi:hypothetical protein